MATDNPTVHVVDDDEAVRESVAFLLEVAGLTVRTYESGPALLAEAARLEPGCVVTDVRMPEMNGLELVKRLRDAGAEHPVVVITGHADVPLAVQAMKAGVTDFIEKPFDDEAFLSAVRSALARAAEGAEQGAARAEAIRKLESLSVRERQVLDGIVEGHANKVIAYDLGISPRTVEVYRANLMTKTGASGVSELVRLALLARPA